MKDAAIGVFIGIVGAGFTWLVGENAINALVVGVGTGVICSVALPFFEGAYWWLKRDGVLLEEAKQEIKELLENQPKAFALLAEGKRRLEAAVLQELLSSDQPSAVGLLLRQLEQQAKTEKASPFGGGSGVTFTGGEWEREHAQELLEDDAQQLRAPTSWQPSPRPVEELGELSFVKLERLLNGVELALDKSMTSLRLAARNTNPEVVEGLKLWVEEPLRFSGGRFVKQREFQDYRPIQLMGGSNRLFHDQIEHYPFLNHVTGRLCYSGASDSNSSAQGSFETLGIWKVTFLIELEHSSVTRELFFNWEHERQTIPLPCSSPIET